MPIANYLLRAEESSFSIWKAVSASRGMTLAGWIRSALNREANREMRRIRTRARQESDGETAATT